MDEVKIHLGGASRGLRFDFDNVEDAEDLVGNEDLWVVVLTKLSSRNLFRIAAVGFSRKSDRVSPPQVREWIQHEPTKLPELEKAVALAVAVHQNRVGKMTDEDLRRLGEALASVAAANAGTPASAPAVASGSTSGESTG